MKVVKLIAIIVAAVLLFVGISYLFFKTLYYRLFYPWNRINGTICITIDGKEYKLKESDVTGSHESEEIGIGFRNGTDGTKVSIHGGDYGPYTLMIHVDGISAPLEVVVYQYNWWNVSEFDLDISIDNTKETISFNSTAQVLDEDGIKVTEKHSTRAKFSDGYYVHHVVSV